MKRRCFMGLLTAALAHSQPTDQATNQQSPPADASASGFAIAGVVVNSISNAPLGKALVQISLASARSQNRFVVTGSDGRFSFTNLSANKFALIVTRSSGMPQSYLEHGSFSSAIVTGPDQRTTELIFRFRMPGILTGIILDESNEPVRNANVHLFGHQMDQTGILRTVITNNTATRASGRFRFANLIPGTYFVAVSGRPWFAENGHAQFAYGQGQVEDMGFGFHPGRPIPRPDFHPDPQFDVVYPFTYYPNAADPASASPISITEGNETALQMTLRTAPSIHVRLLGGDPKPGAGMNVQVSAMGPENLPIPLNVGVFTQGGQGELTGVAAGRYLLQVHGFNNPRGLETSVDVEEQMTARDNGFARRIVDLVDGATVDIGAVSHISVKGIVKTATSERPTNRLSILLHDQRTGNRINAVAAADDTIRFPEANLSSGRYQVLLPTTPMFRVLSLEAKGAKVVAGELLLEDNADVQLSISIGRKSSIEIAGFALKDDAPLVGGLVLLLPKAAAVGAATYRDQSDSDGSFALHNVSAGSYLALAIENGHDLPFGDPAVLKPYLAGAQTVTVNESNAPPLLKLKAQQLVAR